MHHFSSCIGTTTVNVKVFNADEEQIFQWDLKVKVKKNAADVTVTGIADGDKFSVGQEIPVTLPRQGVDTDERELTVDKTDIVELKTGEKARTYTVKFLKAGEATFTAKAYQSAKYPAATQTKTIKVTVTNPVPSDAKIIASNAYQLTFDEDVEAFGLFSKTSDIKVDALYYMVENTKVSFSAVKAIKATGNTVKVTVFDCFDAGKDYFVVINECEPIKMSVTNTSKKDVDHIVFVTKEVEVNKPTDVEVALFNKDNIDITAAVTLEDVSISCDQLKALANGRTVQMYNVGDVVAFTAKYSYYDANDNYKEYKAEATANITCVAPASDIKTGIEYSTNGNLNNIKHYITLGDPYNTKFIAKLKYKNKDTAKEIIVGKTTVPASTYNNQTLKAWIADESIAIISNLNTATGEYDIVGNKVGNTNVFIGYTDNNKDYVVDVCPIEVRAKRHAATLQVTAGSMYNLDAGTMEVVAKVFDQNGDPFDVTGLTLQQTTASQKTSTLTAAYGIKAGAGAGVYNFTLGDGVSSIAPTTYTDNTGVHSYTNGTMQFTTKVNDSDSTAAVMTTNFSWKSAGTTVKAYSFENTGAATLDTAIKSTTDVAAATITLTGTTDGGYYAGPGVLNTNGYYNTKIGATVTGIIKADNEIPQAGAVSGAGFSYVIDIKHNGNRVVDNVGAWKTDYAGFFVKDDANGKITLKNLIMPGGAGTMVKKLPKGTYTFTLYLMKDNTITKVVPINVTVNDNQTNPTYTQQYQNINDPNAGSVDKCFKFSFDNQTPVPAAVDYDCNESGTYGNGTFVKDVDITVNASLKENGVTTAGIYTFVNFTIGKLLTK